MIRFVVKQGYSVSVLNFYIKNACIYLGRHKHKKQAQYIANLGSGMCKILMPIIKGNSDNQLGGKLINRK